MEGRFADLLKTEFETWGNLRGNQGLEQAGAPPE